MKGISYVQLIKLLGEPEEYSKADSNILYYNIVTEYRYNIDPIYIKNLEIKLSTDSIVTSISINEIKH